MSDELRDDLVAGLEADTAAEARAPAWPRLRLPTAEYMSEHDAALGLISPIFAGLSGLPP